MVNFDLPNKKDMKIIATKIVEALRSTWKAQKASLKKRFPELTDTDLNFSEGNKNEMFEKLQSKLGFSPNELQVIALS